MNLQLVGELKETLDMLSKAKWEAETGGVDAMGGMTEEENEVGAIIYAIL